MSVSYNDHIPYNMRSYFSRQPGEMLTCPMCHAELIQSDIPPSQSVSDDLSCYGMIPGYDFSHMLTCPDCRWWYFRESWSFCEIYQDYDYMAMGLVKKWDLSAKRTAFAFLRESLQEKRNSSFHKTIDHEEIRRIFTAYSKATAQACEVHWIGTSPGKDDNPSDVYWIEEDDSWMILVNRSMVSDAELVDAIDLLNGVILEENRPVGMIVTTTDLLFEQGDLKEIKGYQGKCDAATLKYYQQIRPNDYLREYRKVFRVQFAEGGFAQKLLERIPAPESDPWQKALADPSLYNKSLNLPEIYMPLFSEAQQKKS